MDVQRFFQWLSPSKWDVLSYKISIFRNKYYVEIQIYGDYCCYN